MATLIGICGVGFVGGALEYCFKSLNIDYLCYDKYKKIGNFNDLLKTSIIFLCLPTLFNNTMKCYDKTSINEICNLLQLNNYKGTVVLKSTVETGTTDSLSESYNLNMVHNPEFLTARTANFDFLNQSHIVLGKSINCNELCFNNIKDFYKNIFPISIISITSSNESEAMKLFCNSFYSVKIGFFNELYDYCKNKNIKYDTIKDLMLKNGWVNKMHTDVPGPDGKLGFGGACFPKDTNALLYDMKQNNSHHTILQAVVTENNIIRNNLNNEINNIKKI